MGAGVTDSSSPLPQLRAELDTLDRQVLELLARRQQIVSAVAAYKRRHNIEIRDAERERQLLQARRDLATELGLEPESIESIYRQILLASRDHQAAIHVASAPATDPKRVLIVGGAGAMGRLFSDFF